MADHRMLDPGVMGMRVAAGMAHNKYQEFMKTLKGRRILQAVFEKLG